MKDFRIPFRHTGLGREAVIDPFALSLGSQSASEVESARLSSHQERRVDTASSRRHTLCVF